MNADKLTNRRKNAGEHAPASVCRAFARHPVVYLAAREDCAVTVDEGPPSAGIPLLTQKTPRTGSWRWNHLRKRVQPIFVLVIT